MKALTPWDDAGRKVVKLTTLTLSGKRTALIALSYSRSPLIVYAKMWRSALSRRYHGINDGRWAVTAGNVRHGRLAYPGTRDSTPVSLDQTARWSTLNLAIECGTTLQQLIMTVAVMALMLLLSGIVLFVGLFCSREY